MFSIIFICCLIALQVTMKKNGYKTNKMNDFLKRDMEANFTKSKKINEDIFIIPDTKKLPIKEYPDKEEYKKTKKAQDTVIKKSVLKMVYFTEPISNTDLKFKYGLNNLENITMYEEHYNAYIRSLIEWGKILIENENFQDAEIVLKEAIYFHSDLSINYTLLADIYIKENNKSKFEELKSKIQNSNLKMKNKILNYMNNINIK